MSETRTAIFNMRITPEERQAWKQAALQSGLTMTGWARAMLNANLGSALTEGELSAVGEQREPETATRLSSRLQGEPSSPSANTEIKHVISDAGEVKRVVTTLRPGRVFAPDPKPAGRKKKR